MGGQLFIFNSRLTFNSLIFLVEGKLLFDRFNTNERFVRFRTLIMSQFR